MTPQDNNRVTPAFARSTLAAPVTVRGTGIHSGAPCALHCAPAPSGAGIMLHRAGAESCPATWSYADAVLSDRRTVVVAPGGKARYEQIEHVMAALVSEGITDVSLTFEGPEVPFLGGGSKEYVEAIRTAGRASLEGEQPVLEITRPVAFQDGDALLVAAPHDGFRLSAFVEFPGTVVGNMGYTIELDADSFLRDVAPARTFALASDIEKLRAAGLGRGGNLQNAVIFDNDRYHNESLHFPDEVARHKIIDLLGDLALAGCALRGHFWAWRAGHRSHVGFVQFLAKEFRLQ